MKTPNFFNSIALAAGLAAAALAATPASASSHASTQFDGLWSVVIITESGDCDRAYRYPVRIANGALRHADSGDQNFVISGQVQPNGSVHGSVQRDNSEAVAAGRLSAENGSGTWRGKGSTGVCSGRWEAERRGGPRSTTGSGD
jgi:hypothetical protein